MRVCLVGAPTLTDYVDPEVLAGAEVRAVGSQIPLGVLTLASTLELEGYPTIVVAANRWYLDYVQRGDRAGISFSAFMASRLAAIPADVFGFSTICNSYPVSLQTVEALKRLRPDAVTVLGGPQAS